MKFSTCAAVLVVLVVVVNAVDVDRAKGRVTARSRVLEKLQSKERTETMTPWFAGRKVFVTMSYMDEETASVLKAALAKQEGDKSHFARIYVIERSRAPNPEKWLFERPVHTYPGQSRGIYLWQWKGHWQDAEMKPSADGNKYHKDAVKVSTGGSRSEDDELVDKLKEGLSDKMGKNAELNTKLRAATVVGQKSKSTTNKADPAELKMWQGANILAFGPIDKKAGKPILIIIRTQEMGMNQAQFEEFNDYEMRGLRQALGDIPISLFFIGASGAANSKDCTGALHSYHSSTYVGARLKKTGDGIAKMSALPVIGFDALTDPVRTDDHAAAGTNHATVWSGAKAAAAGTGKLFGAELDKAKTEFSKAKAQPKLQWVKNLKSKIDGDKSNGETSMTGGYFMGMETKYSSNAVGSQGANTEDDLMIRLANRLIADNTASGALYPKLNKVDKKWDVGVFRADADPYPNQVYEQARVDDKIHYWIKHHKCVDKNVYKAVLKWAFGGMYMNKVPPEMCWTWNGVQHAGQAVTDLPASFFQKATTTADTQCPVVPMYVEIATDMTKDVAGYDAPPAHPVFQAATVQAAKDLLDVDSSGRDAAINTLVDNLKTDFDRITPCAAGKLAIFQRGGWKPEDDNRKWHGAYSFTQCTGDNCYKPDAEAADRLLYKANNFKVMDVLAEKLFTFADGKVGLEKYRWPAKFTNNCE